MKFLIDANELKKLMKTVKRVFGIYTSKDNLQKICLLHGNPSEKTITLEFSQNDVFIKHKFVDVDFGGQKEPFKRSIDLSALADLNFSEPLVELSLSENKIHFKNGSLSGNLVLSGSDIEKAIERSRPNEWTYRYNFKLASFLEAMDAHSYGKHTDSNALDRPVRFIAKNGKNVFLSQDKIAACFLKKDEDIESADIFFYPSIMIQILKSLDKNPGSFWYEETENIWSVLYDRTNIWGPKPSGKPPRQDIISIVKMIKEADAYAVKIQASEFSKHLSSIKPFFDGSDLKDKDAAPFVTLLFRNGSHLELRVANRRAFDVHKEIDVVYSGTLEEPIEQSFVLNYEFMVEFISSIIKNSEEKSCELEIRWWPYADDKYPTRGRAVSFSDGSNYYIVSRVNMQKGVPV